MNCEERYGNMHLSGIMVEILETGGKGAPWLFLQPYSPPSCTELKNP